ncbi:MAG: hypothetical protein ABFR90_07650 [Planctomycetota bacterium]
MLRQIEKLQRIVNNLLGLCADSGTDAVLDDLPPDSEAKKYERLGVMLLQVQDGVLEERYLRRMEKWLLCDKAALRHYVDFQTLTVLLQMHFNPARFRAHLPGQMSSLNVD